MPYTTVIFPDVQIFRNSIYLLAFTALIEDRPLMGTVVAKTRYQEAMVDLCASGHLAVVDGGYVLTAAGIAAYREHVLNYWLTHSHSRIHPPAIIELFDEQGNPIDG